MKWSKEAEDLISKVPFFVKKRVKKRVEEEAEARGADVVTADHVNICRNRFINKMEDEVKGFQVETCFSSGGCPNSIMDVAALSDGIEEILSEENIRGFLKEKVNGPLKFHHEFRVSISGCPNACSRPQIADVGIIGVCAPKITGEKCGLCGECERVCGEEAVSLISDIPEIDESKCLLCGQCVRVCPDSSIEQGAKGFKILVGGKLGRHPRLATEIPEIYSGGESLKKVKEIIRFYKDKSVKGERIGAILEKNGIFDMNQGKENPDDILCI
jgi:anaerobic sulfite reductase subunit C